MFSGVANSNTIPKIFPEQKKISFDDTSLSSHFFNEPFGYNHIEDSNSFEDSNRLSAFTIIRQRKKHPSMEFWLNIETGLIQHRFITVLRRINLRVGSIPQ